MRRTVLVIAVTALTVATAAVLASLVFADPYLQKDLCKVEGLGKYFPGLRNQVQCARFVNQDGAPVFIYA